MLKNCIIVGCIISIAIYSVPIRAEGKAPKIEDVIMSLQILSGISVESYWDSSRDGKIGLSDPIITLQQVAGFRPYLKSLSIIYPSLSFFVGETAQLQAIANYSNSTSTSITNEVFWKSEDPSILIVNNDSDKKGLLKSADVGSTFITVKKDRIIEKEYIIIKDPNKPASINLSASPTLILSDGNDYSAFVVDIIPQKREGGKIPENTEVEFNLLSGSAIIDPSIANSVNGKVNSKVYSKNPGDVSIEVKVQGADISRQKNVKFVNSFNDYIKKYTGLAASIINGYYSTGSQFSFSITNTSDRTFSLNKFDFKNGSETIKSTTDPSLLNGGELAPGKNVSLSVTLSKSMQDNGFSAIYYLSTIESQSDFTVRGTW